MNPAQRRAELDRELGAARATGHRIPHSTTPRTPEGAAENRARSLARRRALSDLTEQHPDEYAALIETHLDQARFDTALLELRRLARQPL